MTFLNTLPVVPHRVEKAERAMEEGDYRQCIALLSRAISLDPSNHTLFKLRAAAFLGQADYTPAIANYNKTVSLYPKEAGGVASKLADAHFKRGEKLFGGGDYNSALVDFIAASKLCPEKRIYTISRWVQWVWLVVGVVCPDWSLFVHIGSCLSRMDCLLCLGRSEECLGMVQEELTRGSPTPQLYLMHAKINLLFEKVNHTLVAKFSVSLNFSPFLTEWRSLPKHSTDSRA